MNEVKEFKRLQKRAAKSGYRVQLFVGNRLSAGNHNIPVWATHDEDLPLRDQLRIVEGILSTWEAEDDR